jgi:hypothetical protein
MAAANAYRLQRRQQLCPPAAQPDPAALLSSPGFLDDGFGRSPAAVVSAPPTAGPAAAGAMAGGVIPTTSAVAVGGFAVSHPASDCAGGSAGAGGRPTTGPDLTSSLAWMKELTGIRWKAQVCVTALGGAVMRACVVGGILLIWCIWWGWVGWWVTCFSWHGMVCLLQQACVRCPERMATARKPRATRPATHFVSSTAGPSCQGRCPGRG